MAASGSRRVVLDGFSLTCRTLTQLGAPGSKIAICPDAMGRIKEARKVVDRLVERGFDEGHVAYGINTGFGLFADVIIDNDELATLQRNLIRSHSAGVGAPLSPAETRRLLALRLNVLAKGHSGIRTETVDKMVAAFNADCLSVVPAQGTVGASGDLAPLSVRSSLVWNCAMTRGLLTCRQTGFCSSCRGWRSLREGGRVRVVLDLQSSSSTCYSLSKPLYLTVAAVA